MARRSRNRGSSPTDPVHDAADVAAVERLAAEAPGNGAAVSHARKAKRGKGPLARAGKRRGKEARA